MALVRDGNIEMELGILSHAPSSSSQPLCQTQRRNLVRVRSAGRLLQRELSSSNTKLRGGYGCLLNASSAKSLFSHSSCSCGIIHSPHPLMPMLERFIFGNYRIEYDWSHNTRFLATIFRFQFQLHRFRTIPTSVTDVTESLWLPIETIWFYG